MSDFIQGHVLKINAAGNSNRDDSGRPKTMIYGKEKRARHSSQAVKRLIRCSDIFQESLENNLGTRSKYHGRTLIKYLLNKDVALLKAISLARSITENIGALVHTIKSQKSIEKYITEQKEKNSDFNELELADIQQLVFLSHSEAEKIYKLLDTLISEDRDIEKKDFNFLSTDITSVDIAMFGRMLASRPEYNIEGAVQVSHSFSVNKGMIEDDFFAAVDDLNEEVDHSGSGFIGESNFTSGVFYTYFCINKTLLVKNLNGNEALANKSIKAFIEAIATTTLTGKQNSFASRYYADYLLLEKGKQSPRQLSGAFLKTIESNNMILTAIEHLETYRNNMNRVYGSCCDDSIVMNVQEGKGSLSEVLDFAVE